MKYILKYEFLGNDLFKYNINIEGEYKMSTADSDSKVAMPGANKDELLEIHEKFELIVTSAILNRNSRKGSLEINIEEE